MQNIQAINLQGAALIVLIDDTGLTNSHQLLRLMLTQGTFKEL